MKITCAIIGFLMLCCECSPGQQDSANSSELFRLPEIELQLTQDSFHSRPATLSELQLTPTGNSIHPTAQVSLASNPSDAAIQWHRRLERGGYFTRREPAQNPFVRWTDAIFRPEPVRVGKATVSCSIMTAIKRKNPLCLISPRLFDLSW